MIKTLLWTESEETIKYFELDLFSTLYSSYVASFNGTKFNLVKSKMKNEGASKIIKISEDGTFSLIFKRNSVWTSISFENLIYYWICFANEGKTLKSLSDLKKTSLKMGVNFPFKVNDDNKEKYKKIIEFYTNEDSIDIISKLTSDHSFVVKQEIRECDDLNLFKVFKEKILERPRQPGIEFTKSSLKEDGHIICLTKYGEFEIYFEDDNIIINCLQWAKTNDKYIIEKFSDSTLKNIYYNIFNEMITTNVPKKITKKDIFTWIFSISIVSVLFYITFTFIYDNTDSGIAFKIIFDKFTWSNIWIYLMSINFLFSLVYGPLLTMIVLRVMNGNKMSIRSFFNTLASLQVRMVVAFVTGNAILATVLWAWYMASVNKARVVSVVGMISTFSLVRGIMMLPIGGIFMIRGTIFDHTIMSEAGILDQYYAYVTLSWIGWIWHIIHNMSISLLIVLPPMHILYNRFVEIWYGRKGNTTQLINRMTKFENNLVLLKQGSKNMFKKKDAMFRAGLFIVVGIIIELFEFTYGLKMVEDYNIHYDLIAGMNKGSYWNLFAISSVRFMSGYAYHVPILNAVPGQGMGITDAMLKASTTGVINHAHLSENLSQETLNSLSSQTTLIMRFYNFYMRRIIALFFVIFVTLRIVYIKKIKKNNINIYN